MRLAATGVPHPLADTLRSGNYHIPLGLTPRRLPQCARYAAGVDDQLELGQRGPKTRDPHRLSRGQRRRRIDQTHPSELEAMQAYLAITSFDPTNSASKAAMNSYVLRPRSRNSPL
ncbi:MAG: hypothetical protein GY925_03490 [Actinomycetia bacterium]|nr:hypothetical protein [Actinomycetes bacterium]